MGRVIGHSFAVIIGTGTSIRGIFDIINSINTADGMTMVSGVTLTLGGVSIAVSGTVAGAIEVGYGSTVVLSAASGFGDDLDKLNNITCGAN